MVSSATAFHDPALQNTFGRTAPANWNLKPGDSMVVALQYALGRLGYLRSRVDGVPGADTTNALTRFRADHGLPPAGPLDAQVIGQLDRALAGLDTSLPAAEAQDPLTYLRSFAALGFAPLTISAHSQPINWSHPEIRAAYEAFVPAYWAVLKKNRIEADCKTLVAFIMDAFRAKVHADLGVELGLPGTTSARIRAMKWDIGTPRHAHGYCTRLDNLGYHPRPGYESIQLIQAIDPGHSLLRGVNLRPQDIGTDEFTRAAAIVHGWDAKQDNRGDTSRPEVPIADLRPGMLIFIDHEGDGRFDHCITVADVQRDADGRVRTVVLSVGSYDDLKDEDHATRPRGVFEINNYAEELTVVFDAGGRVVSSTTTWTSEPEYESKPTYRIEKTLMELHAGGRLKVCEWRDP